MSGTALGLAALASPVLGHQTSKPQQTRTIGQDQVTAVPPLSLRRTEVPVPLVLPTPYPSVGTEMVHPSVVYCAEGWHGYSRWMAITPYPHADRAYENPSILVSNDGMTWEVPPGVTNPIVERPAGVASGAYNSDPHLVLSPDRKKLYLLYRAYASEEPREQLKLMETSDGRTWSTPTTIFTSNSKVRRLVAPSMWFDGAQYVIVACDMVQPGNPFVRLANGSADAYKGWPATPADMTLEHPVSGGSWWHGFFSRQANGLISGLIQDGGPGGGNLYLADSRDDGETFEVAPFDLGGGSYRSCFVITSPTGSGMGEVYLGRCFPFNVSFARAVFDRPKVKSEIAARIAGLLEDAKDDAMPGTFVDDFTRADASSLGTANSGQGYALIGSFGISAGRAYPMSAGNNLALADLGPGGENVRLLGRFDTVGTEGFLVFRAKDDGNYWRLGFIGGGFRLQKIESRAVGINIDIGAQARMNTAYRQTPVEVLAVGNEITVLMDGEPLLSTEDLATPAHTKVGLAASGATPTYFDLLVAQRLE